MFKLSWHIHFAWQHFCSFCPVLDDILYNSIIYREKQSNLQTLQNLQECCSMHEVSGTDRLKFEKNLIKSKLRWHTSTFLTSFFFRHFCVVYRPLSNFVFVLCFKCRHFPNILYILYYYYYYYCIIIKLDCYLLLLFFCSFCDEKSSKK